MNSNSSSNSNGKTQQQSFQAAGSSRYDTVKHCQITQTGGKLSVTCTTKPQPPKKKDTPHHDGSVEKALEVARSMRWD